MMIWGSLDTFLVEEVFWQDMMGKPVANKGFLHALLTHGSFQQYRFYCRDTHEKNRFHHVLQRTFGKQSMERVHISLQALFDVETKGRPADIVHLGDFTYYMPYLMEYRNTLEPRLRFPVTGVTHSLDGAWMHLRLIETLLSCPRPYDAIVCTSLCARRMLERSFQNIREVFEERWGCVLPGPPNLVHIPLGISEENLELQDPNECRREMGIPEGHVVILSLGRFSLRNKMDLSPFLECIRWTKKRSRVPDFTLVLAGSGKDHDIRLVQDMVRGLGLCDCVKVVANVPPEKKMSLYGASDIFVSMVDNYQETFGLTILEAMAHGLPVIASDFNGYRELVHDGRTGILIPTYASPLEDPWESISGLLDPSVGRFLMAQKVSFDFAALARALEALLSSSELRRRMGVRAMGDMQRRIWSHVVRQYEHLWTELRKECLGRERKGKEREQSHNQVLIPSMKKSFSHYPSVPLEEHTCVSLSPYGREMLEEGFEPVMYEEMASLLQAQVLREIVQRTSEQQIDICSLADRITGLHGGSRERVILHVDWLIKHGFLTVHSPTKQILKST